MAGPVAGRQQIRLKFHLCSLFRPLDRMRKRRIHRSGFIGATVAALTLSSGAFGQTPQHTTATYGDWILQCQISANGHACEITQSVQIKGQRQPFTQIAIARPKKEGPVKVAFLVPVDVWLSSGVTLTTAKGQSEIAARFTHCVPAGCVAEAEIGSKVIESLRRRSTNGKLNFKNSAKHDVAVPVSFKGFGEAYAAMVK